MINSLILYWTCQLGFIHVPKENKGNTFYKTSQVWLVHSETTSCIPIIWNDNSFFQIESSSKKHLKFCFGIHPKKQENTSEKMLY